MNGAIPHQITHRDLMAWAWLCDRKPPAFEIEIFQSLEESFWRAYNEPNEEPRSIVKQMAALKAQTDRTPLRTVAMNPRKKP